MRVKPHTDLLHPQSEGQYKQKTKTLQATVEKHNIVDSISKDTL